MKIYAPVKQTNGVRASVRFVNGVGETDDPRLIKWFVDHGYTVEESLRVEQAATVQVEELVEDVEEAAQPDFESMTPNELRDWAREHGLGMQIGNIRNKEKLLKIVRG